ncbi:hypothetical protein L3X38_000312, partial [Prunus dulcis]
GSTQREIEDEMGVKIIMPSSKEEDSVIIEGISMESISRASEKIHTIIDEAIKSQNLDYSHFISLPLAMHPELVDKLVNFYNSILGISYSCVDEKMNSESNEDTSENEEEDQKLEKGTDVAAELNVEGDSEQVEVNLTHIPLLSYAPTTSKASTLSASNSLNFGVPTNLKPVSSQKASHYEDARVVTHPGIAPASNSLNFGVPTNPKPVSSQKASHYEDARCAI